MNSLSVFSAAYKRMVSSWQAARGGNLTGWQNVRASLGQRNPYRTGSKQKRYEAFNRARERERRVRQMWHRWDRKYAASQLKQAE